METDVACFELLWVGWSWSRKKEECELREGELVEEVHEEELMYGCHIFS